MSYSKQNTYSNDLFAFQACACLCAAEIFTVKGNDASDSDFGYKFDDAPDEADAYGCGNKVFRRFSRLYDMDKRTACCKKYGITDSEYDEICDVLEKELSFGRCGWCI